MLALYHHAVQSKVFQQGQAVRTQSVSVFFNSKGLRASFAVSKAVMNKPLLGLRGSRACVCIRSCSCTNAGGLLLLDVLL